MIPKQFILHGHTIKVIVEDYDKDNRYGYYNDVKEEIHLFKRIRVEDEFVELTDVQIQASFWHEVVHAVQFHIGADPNEMIAQTVSGLIIEFIKSSNIVINPNVVHEPARITEDY